MATSPSQPPGAPTRSDSIPPVAISRGLDRRILIGGAAVVVVIGFAIWSMAGGEPEPPPSWDTGTGTTPTAKPQTPAPIAAAPTTPTDAPVVTTPPAAALPDPEPAAPTPTGIVAPNVPTVIAVPDTAPIAAAPPEPQPPKSIHLRISTSPTNADITLDGDAVPNPFDAWVPRAGTHAITLSAEGFVERTWDVNFDQDRTLALALKREAARRTSARRPPRPSTPRTPTPRRDRPRGAGFVTDNPY
jgi:hypothetical protein